LVSLGRAFTVEEVAAGEAAPEGPAPEEATAAEGIATAEEAAEEAVVHEQD
jgi:hypothetical protein